MSDSSIVTIERFILDQERMHPEATGDLTNLLYDVALAAKVISGYVRRAGLVDVLGAFGHTNVQGEEQQKLDVIANETMKQAVGYTGRVCVIAGEEDREPIPIPPEWNPGKYVLLYDPLDGSSNIDMNVSIGTIFSVHMRKTESGPGTLEDCLQPGRDQIAAGYVIYGSSTVLVYSAGHGVHFFTLDPTIGEFRLFEQNVLTPPTGRFLIAFEMKSNTSTSLRIPTICSSRRTRRIVKSHMTKRWAASLSGASSSIVCFSWCIRSFSSAGVMISPTSMSAALRHISSRDPCNNP